MGIQINGQTDTISSTDGSLNIGGTVTVNVTGDATGLTGTPDITVGAVTASSATISGDLTVNGTTTTLDTTLTEVDKLEVGANNTTVGVAITQSGTGDILRLYDSSTQVVTVKDGGSVGIGTDDPQGVLHLLASDAKLIIQDSDSSGNSGTPRIQFQDSTGAPAHGEIGYVGTGDSDLSIINKENANIQFLTNNTEALRITSSGKVGIGSDNPGQALSIAGNSVSLGIYNTGNNHGNVYFYKDGTAKGWLKYRGDNERVIIGNVTDAIQIDSSGQVIAASATLNYQGTATPYNNNNLTLTGTQSIGLIGQYSAINWPSDHSNAVTTEPWYMMGRPNGTTDRWSLVIRPGSSNSRYNIIDCYNNANGTIESLRFGTNAGNEALRIDVSGCIRVGNTHSQTTSTNTKRIALGAKANIWGWTSGTIDGALTLADNYYWDGANNRAIEADNAAYLSLRSGSLRFGTTDSTPSAGGVTGLTEKFQIDNSGSIIQKTSSAVDNTEGSNSANSNYHARGASFNKIVSVNNNSPVTGQCMNMLSHTRYLTLNGSTNYDMITIGNREGCFIGHIYAGYATGSDGAVAMYKFHTFYGGASTLTAEISPQSRSSDTISVSMVQGANGDQHTIRVSGNGYTGEVTIGVVFLSASRTGDNHFTVRYY